MSLKIPFPKTIPTLISQVAEELLSEDSVYRFVGEQIDELLNDEMFRSM